MGCLILKNPESCMMMPKNFQILTIGRKNKHETIFNWLMLINNINVIDTVRDR